MNMIFGRVRATLTLFGIVTLLTAQTGFSAAFGLRMEGKIGDYQNHSGIDLGINVGDPFVCSFVITGKPEYDWSVPVAYYSFFYCVTQIGDLRITSVGRFADIVAGDMLYAGGGAVMRLGDEDLSNLLPTADFQAVLLYFYGPGTGGFLLNASDGATPYSRSGA